MSLFVLVWLLPFALLAETPEYGAVALPTLSADSHPEEVLRQYPLGAVSVQSALAAHGAPDRMQALPNRLVGWAYSFEEGNAGAAPVIYTLVFDAQGQVVDVLYRRDADTMSALRVRGVGDAAPGQAERGWGWHHMEGYDYGHHWGFGIVFWVLILLVVVVVAVFLVRAFGHGNTFGRAAPHEKRPLDILKERYAKGEIDHDEFEKRKRDLQGNGSGP